MKGKRVCVVDADPQGNLTQSLGYRNQDEMDETLADLLKALIEPRDNLSRGCEADSLDPEQVSIAKEIMSITRLEARDKEIINQFTRKNLTFAKGAELLHMVRSTIYKMQRRAVTRLTEIYNA